MKQVKSLYNSNSQELLGRVTLNDKNIFNRSKYILVTNEKKFPKGYKGIISTHDLSDNTSIPYIKVDNISDFNDGDVLNITTDGEICFLYEINSKSNTIFATARCNHRCIMCPQPPVLQEKDRTNFNLDLIKLFDENTQEVGITGGEPTMIGDRLFDIIRQIKKIMSKSCHKYTVKRSKIRRY